MHPTFHIDLLVILLMIAAAVGITVKWIRLPYSIALVIVGLIIGITGLLPKTEMTPDLVLLVCLPALLFEASWNIDLEELKANSFPIAIFATVGVIISMFVVGMLMHSFAGLDMSSALLFGAMISATDPISVIALFRRLGIDRQLTLLIEGESLFNDGIAVVLFQLMLSIILGGGNFSLPSSIIGFVLVVIGGGAVGCLLGFGASRLIRLFDDHLLEITLTTIVAYGSYLLAEQLHVSPVIAVVTAGIVLGNYGSHTAMSPSTRLAVNSFWEYAAFVVNSLLFLLIGLQIKFDLLAEYLLPITIAVPTVIVARAIAIYGLSFLLPIQKFTLPWKWRHVIVWGGLRGALCMALALSLPYEFPQRELLVFLTFGVVLFTLLVPGLTIEPIVKLFQISSPDKDLEAHQKLKAQLTINLRVIDHLAQLQRTRSVSDVISKRLHDHFVSKQHELAKAMEQIHLTNDAVRDLEEVSTKRRLIELQKDAVGELVRVGALNHDAAQEIRAELDSELNSLPW